MEYECAVFANLPILSNNVPLQQLLQLMNSPSKSKTFYCLKQLIVFLFSIYKNIHCLYKGSTTDYKYNQ